MHKVSLVILGESGLVIDKVHRWYIQYFYTALLNGIFQQQTSFI